MAIIPCRECGRAISDQAPACIGCGAPLAPRPGIALAPVSTPAQPPTRRQIRTRLVLAILLLFAGIAAARQAGRLPRFSHLLGMAAALLIIVGLVWLLVTLIQRLAPRD